MPTLGTARRGSGRQLDRFGCRKSTNLLDSLPKSGRGGHNEVQAVCVSTVVFVGEAEALESFGAIASSHVEAELLISELMAGLADADRRLLSCWLDDWSWSAIGKELNITPDAARMRWGRLLPVLRDRMTLPRRGSK